MSIVTGTDPDFFQRRGLGGIGTNGGGVENLVKFHVYSSNKGV